MQAIKALAVSAFVGLATSAASAQEIDWQKVDAAFGRKPAVVAGDVHRYGSRAPISR